MKKVYFYMSIIFLSFLMIIIFLGKDRKNLVIPSHIIHIDKLEVQEDNLNILVSPRTSDITFWEYEYYLKDRKLYISFYEKNILTNEVPVYSSNVILPIGYNKLDEIYFEGGDNKLIWSKEIKY